MAVAISGLGASINPARLGDPIEFYGVTDGIYYRHAITGRTFRLMIDRERVAAANNSEVDSREEAEEEISGTADYREVPPDVIAHVFARPIAGWQLEAELGGDGQGLAELARDLADEIDEHVVACPLAAVPGDPAEPALRLTADFALVVLDAVGPISIPNLEMILAGRGVEDTGDTLAMLDQLAAGGEAEVDSPPAGADPLWSVSPAGADRAAKIRAALVALAE